MFNLENYEDVDTRIHKFYAENPDGAIITELVSNDEEKGIVIFKAYAYRTYLDTNPSAVGYAPPIEASNVAISGRVAPAGAAPPGVSGDGCEAGAGAIPAGDICSGI